MLLRINYHCRNIFNGFILSYIYFAYSKYIIIYLLCLFFLFGTIDVLYYSIIYCGSCPVHCGILNNYPLDDSCMSLPPFQF